MTESQLDDHLDPVEVRKLAIKIFGQEEFRGDPKRTIIRALEWLDQAASLGDNQSPQSPAPASRHPIVEQLAAYLSQHAISHEILGRQIGVSPTSIGQWLRGAPPKSASLEKVRAFLESVSASEQVAGPSALMESTPRSGNET